MGQIDWVCLSCGVKHGHKGVDIATWHRGVCDICNKRKTVTQPRDFGYINYKKLNNG